MAIGDTYRVTVLFDQNATNRLNSTRYHIRQDAIIAPSIGDVVTLTTNWWNGIKDRFYAGLSLDHVELRRIDPLEATIQSSSSGMPIAGTASGDELDPQSAVVVSLRTANIGRSYRGRMFLPALAESMQDSGLMGTGVGADIANETLNLVQAGAAAGYPLVVWSATLNVATEVTQVKVDQFLRTQRRRQQPGQAYVVGV